MSYFVSHESGVDLIIVYQYWFGPEKKSRIFQSEKEIYTPGKKGRRKP